ncbi:glycosyltransferase [Kordia jejudonensis]|uniref:glycosyltransferase n=1 Tax=Kordia jejudonensis TaxID=1348245 RepID=UPI0006297D15|nr:glycosyltransferase [Kordia jejudonensis]
MKILFVAMQYIHSARWINQLKDTEHEIYMFDCLDSPIHEDLQWTNYTTNWSKRKIKLIKGETFIKKHFPSLSEKIQSFLKITAAEKLHELILEIQPDVVHSMELQSESYPLIQVREKINFNWICSTWGSDIYHFSKEAFHLKRIQNVLKNADFLFTDNIRDISLATQHGFKGKAMGSFPGGGGFLVKENYIEPLENRNLILVKGYHHWAGRALHALKALENNLELVQKYQIHVYAAHPTVIAEITRLQKEYNLHISYTARGIEESHDALLRKFGQAKIAIGISVTDGIPNTMLEAMIYGAFPIQTNPGNASEEYISHKKNGWLIEDAENSQEITEAVTNALTNESLLAEAFEANKKYRKILSYAQIQQKVLEAYTIIEQNLKNA